MIYNLELELLENVSALVENQKLQHIQKNKALKLLEILMHLYGVFMHENHIKY